MSWFCRAKKEKGITCRSRNDSEEQLQKICAGFMGRDAFDAGAFGESVRGLTVLPDGSLEAAFLDGETKVWEAPPEPVKWYTKTGHGGGRFWTGYMLRFNTVYIVHKHCSPIK